MSMNEGVIENAKNQLATDQSPPTQAKEAEQKKPVHMGSYYRQQVVSTVFDVASTWAKQNNRFPIESDLTDMAKSLMAVISTVEADR